MKTRKPKARDRVKRLAMLDDDGNRVSAGDVVRFSYGIPPVCVHAKLVQRGSKLIALTPGHKPSECNLRNLRKHVGEWFKHTDAGTRKARGGGSY